jgi:hypothetical protein
MCCEQRVLTSRYANKPAQAKDAVVAVCKGESAESIGVAAAAFPAKAGPTRDCLRCLIGGMHAVCFRRTGFSREEASVSAINFSV